MKSNIKKILIVCVVLAVVLTASLTCAVAKANRSKDANKYARFVSVNYGDTLTTIAVANYSREYASVEDLIDEIKKINHIYGDTIYAGDKLIVPYYVH